MKIKVRPEKKTELPEIKFLNDLAFGQENESILVDKLRRSKDFIPELSLVALIEGEILGHILFYPVKIIQEDKEIDTISLAPMSVEPEFQGFGIGGKLVQEGLKAVKKLGHKHVNVLGHPEYYPRFGFQLASKWNIKCPYDGVPDEAFMMIELEKGSLDGVSGTIQYPKVYDDAM